MEKVDSKIIMHCRFSSVETEEFRSKLGFKQPDVIMTKEQLVLKSVKDAFEGKNMQTQCGGKLIFTFMVASLQ